jgi:hypothetical protein
MGNAQSQKKTKETKNTLFNEELINSIDLLASKLIFEQSFENLTKLGNSKYCDEVSILTQKLLKESLDTVNINVISTRVKYGTQDLYVIDDEGFKKLKQVEADRDKAMLCSNVSRFYIRIFQAYSAIVKAINPIYIYKDIEGTEKVRSVFDEISSENKKKADIGLKSLCSRRIFYLKPKKMGEKQMTLQMKNCNMNNNKNQLAILTKTHVNKHEKQPEKTNGEDESKSVTEEPKQTEVEGEPKPVTEETPIQEVEGEPKQEPKQEVEGEPKQEQEGEPKQEVEGQVITTEQPKQVDVNPVENPVKKQEGGDKEQTSGKVELPSDIIETMSLEDEPGIKSLENLYKDKMEIKIEGTNLHGTFVMSKKSRKQYEKDLKQFYKAFVPNGKQTDIKKFSDIKLIDYSKTKECNDGDSKWENEINGTSSNKDHKLFVKYGDHFQKMIADVRERETELINLLHEIFDFDLKKEIPIKIKGDLTEDKLNNEIMRDIKDTVKKMYIDCEINFQQGIQIYNQIYKDRNKM